MIEFTYIMKFITYCNLNCAMLYSLVKRNEMHIMERNNISLLIADDEREIRSGLSRAIDWAKYNISLVGTAKDGTEAYAAIQQLKPDIVITDIKMPGIDGLTLVKKITEEKQICKFIILSGFADFEYAQKAIQYHVREYLLKPIALEELVSTVNRALEEVLQERANSRESSIKMEKLKQARAAARRQQLIPELLYQEIPEHEIHDLLDRYSLPISNTSSCVVLLKYKVPSSDAEADDEDPETNSLPFSEYTSLKEELKHSLKGFPAICSFTGDHLITIICNLPFSPAGSPGLKDFLAGFIGMIAKKFAIKAHAAIGETVQSLIELSDSYKSALKTLSYSIYSEMPAVITTQVLKNSAEPPNLSQGLPYDSILDSILQGNTEHTVELFNQFFSRLMYIPAPPPNYLFSMCNYLLLDMNQRIVKYTGVPLQCYPGDSYHALQSLENVDEIKRWMISALLGFIAELRIRSVQKTDPIIESVMKYIRQNIFKKIRIEDICTHVGLSKSYFTTYFKNKTKLNFRDYILDLKISYAMEQLRTSKHTPSELAIMLGYENYRSFNRAFKNRTGYTPSDYQRKYLFNQRG